MQLIQYDADGHLQRIEQDMNRFFHSDWQFPSFSTVSTPLDMYEEQGNLVIKATLPNVAKDDIKITTENNVLTITADHHESDTRSKQRHYYLRESSNQYVRRVSLPEGVRADESKADFQRGILTVSMPHDSRQLVHDVSIGEGKS